VTGPGHIPEGFTHAAADTEFGNALDVLERGVERPEEGALLGALFALSLRLEPPLDDVDALELGGHMVWLATHTPCEALSSLDAALGEAAAPLWRGVAAPLISDGSGTYSAAEALVAAAALRKSTSAEAQALRAEAAAKASDPALATLLWPSLHELGAELIGETQPPPRSAWVTVALGVTLILFVIEVLRLIARYAFAYRKPAGLRLGPEGLEVSERTELMGRILRDRTTLIPFSNLARVTREVRYARAGLYAGLIALTFGTYLGTGLFVDAIRVPGGSGPLLGLAALFIVIGFGIDFALSTGADSLRGRCRVVVVQHEGSALCVGTLDPMRADALLAALAEQARPAATSQDPETPPPVETPSTEPAREPS
jgi:hypothetical protein